MNSFHIRQKIDDVLMGMADADASDVYIRAEQSPVFRIHGRIRTSGLPVVTERDLEIFLEEILPAEAHKRFSATGDLDIAYTVTDRARFRINVFRHGGRIALVARLIPLGDIRFEDLNLPDSIRKMAEVSSGLVLVVGPTGCGKSTTLAALVNHINQTRAAHIVTIEDPIEFVFQEKKSLIHQRQVGFDTVSFAQALRHVVRQAPDVVMIGEMRDEDTVQTAVMAALTGHLILSTLHTTNVTQSIDRMLSYFPPGARQQAQNDLATTLIGVVSMRLLPRKDGRGRVPAVEILRCTSTVRRLIQEGSLSDIYDIMKRSGDLGMCTLNQSLVRLVQEDLVTGDVAMRLAPNQDEFKLNMEGMFTGIDSIDLRTLKKRKGSGDE